MHKGAALAGGSKPSRTCGVRAGAVTREAADATPGVVPLLVEVAEHNARLLRSAGVRWARDVGLVRADDPVDGRRRPLALGVRERWSGRCEYPYVRAAGSWVSRAGTLPGGLSVAVEDGDGLVAAAAGQLDDGADVVKLYLDGPDRETSPFWVSEVSSVVEAAHARAARVTAHSGMLPGARVGAEAGVDSLEYGFQLDSAVVALMAANNVALVSTLAVLESWRTFSRTTVLPRFVEPPRKREIAARREWAHESVRLAARDGVLIAAGTDLAADRCAPTSSPGRWNAWLPQAWSLGRRWR